MTARKIIGLLVCLVGILIGATLSVMMLGIMLGTWNAASNPGYEGKIVLGISALLGALIGFGIYKLGRKIAG